MITTSFALTRWCLQDLGEHWSTETICRFANKMDVSAIEVVAPEEFGLLKQFGLTCALTTSHQFVRGMNNPLHWDECLGKLRNAIDANAAYSFPNVVTFTGFANTLGLEKGSFVDHNDGLQNCIESYKKIVGYAEKNKVTLCLESLNTRDPLEMLGHPGYQGDHLDFCLEIIEKVGSPYLKLLFDAYHVQIMDGDLIRRIRSLGDRIGHVQIAGVPGRGEPDESQEINYPAVLGTLLEIGYQGHVGLEYIPTLSTSQSLTHVLEWLRE